MAQNASKFKCYFEEPLKAHCVGGNIAKELVSTNLVVLNWGNYANGDSFGKSLWAAGVLHNYPGPLPDKLDPHHSDAEALAKF
jgi:hypothetical protein